MTQTDLPIYDEPEDALKAVVQALGGAKKVGPMLFAGKSDDSAARLLLDCLNHARPEKLDLGQTLKLLRMGKEAGIHSPFAWLAAEVGYSATPITKAEECDRLTTVIEQSTKTLAQALNALERMQRTDRVRVA